MYSWDRIVNCLIGGCCFQGSTGELFVKTQYIAQTLDQMRDATPLSLANPPVAQDIAIPGCAIGAAKRTNCPWDAFQITAQRKIDSNFVSLAANVDDASSPLH